MSDHLPECYLSGPPTLCPMCEALRACEATVRADEHRALITHGALTNLAGYSEGYAAGVQAARDAVAGQCGHTKSVSSIYECDHDRALAAIDALRGES